jgi:hypothetical protein
LIHVKNIRTLALGQAKKEDIVRHVDNNKIEIEKSVNDREGNTQNSNSGDQVARRVAEVLNLVLAQGSMPA